MSKFTQGHALSIGVGADLPNTVTDAAGIAALLRDGERCAYPTEQIQLLTEEKATRADILTALDHLANTTGPETTVVFYFSGHGYEVSTPIGKQYFLMPHGYDTADLLNTAISGQELMAKLQAVKAQKMLILLDCCHAGGIDDATEKSPGVQFVKAPLPEGAAAMLAKGRGRVIISSCKAHEKSYTGDPYSQFTQALLEAFAGANLSQADGYVRAADLALYAAKTVPQHTKDKQNPDLHFDQADNFVVAYYAAGDTQPKGLPAKDQRREAPEDADAGGQPGSTTIHATNSGSGGQAIGNNNKVAGAGGVVADNITGDLLTGDNARNIKTNTYVERQDVQNSSTFNQSGQTVHGNQHNVAGNINTGGGMFNAGNINTGGGDFVGRDKRVYGDVVYGDKIGRDKVGGDKTTVGNISGSNVAIGRNAQVWVNQDTTTTVGDILNALQPILLAAQQAPDAARSEAVAKAEALKSEVVKGAQADDEIVGGLVEDLVKLIPDGIRAITAAFGQPLLKAIVGPVTKFVLRRLGRQ